MAGYVINKPRESPEALSYRGVICNFLSSHSKSNDRTGNSCHLPKVCEACVSKAPKQHILYECKKFMHSLVSDWVLSTSQAHRLTSGRTNTAFRNRCAKPLLRISRTMSHNENTKVKIDQQLKQAYLSSRWYKNYVHGKV